MRRKPYTEIGIRRMKCFRCGSRASQQWNCCADGQYRPICTNCDVALNSLVLTFMRHPGRARLMERYKRKMEQLR